MNFKVTSLDLSFVIGLLFSVSATQIMGMWTTFIIINVFIFSYVCVFSENNQQMLCRGLIAGIYVVLFLCCAIQISESGQ